MNTDWMLLASCADTSQPDQFFADHERDRLELAQVRRLCSTCPVKHACLSYALDNEQNYGIWGGLTSRERHRMARRSAVVGFG